MELTRMFAPVRKVLVAAVVFAGLLAVAAPAANADWHGGGGGWHGGGGWNGGGWHGGGGGGWGWHGGGGWGWHGGSWACCWRNGIFIGVAPPVYAPPPAYYYPPPAYYPPPYYPYYQAPYGYGG
jgi:hypothetical protein